MNTIAAAAQARVTVPTVRAWCRVGAVAAVKRAGRWVIDSVSLAARIAIGRMRTRRATAREFAPLSRAEFEQAAAELGRRTTPKDARCHGEYVAYTATGAPYTDTPYWWLLIRRGATLASEGFTRPAPRSYPHECLTCGLDARRCDCR
ncbi:hypothetical protein [Streptomyces silvensis]|nr:hypothetical protein [Streptomyces silvensis]